MYNKCIVSVPCGTYKEVVFMTMDEKANIILEHLEDVVSVDWNFKDFYIKAIKNGLKMIAILEKEEREREKREHEKI